MIGTFGDLNKIGEITVSGTDLDGTPFVGERTYPFYSCGHCSATVLMRPDRSRPRTTCLYCGRWICEQSEICNTQCTPLYALAADHFPDHPAGKYVDAIMRGCVSIDEAHEKGLVKE